MSLHYWHSAYSLLMFVVKNRDLFKLNSDIHRFNRRYAKDFHLPSAKLKLFQKWAFYSGIKTYNHLPKTIKELSHDVKQFRLALKRCIISNSFYSLEEYFDINWKWVMFCYKGYTAPCKWHVGFNPEIVLIFQFV